MQSQYKIFLNTNTITHNAIESACMFTKIQIKKLFILLTINYLLGFNLQKKKNYHKWCIHQHPCQKLIYFMYYYSLSKSITPCILRHHLHVFKVLQYMRNRNKTIIDLSDKHIHEVCKNLL